MSLASKLLSLALAVAAMLATASVTGEATARAGTTTTIIGYGTGSGSTAAAAELAAKRDLISNYHGCQLPPNLVYDTDDGGLWNARVTATCQWAN